MWPKVSFGSICELRNGRAFKPEEWSSEGTPIVRIQNLNDESKPFNYCAFEVDPKFGVNTGDLLFSWSGTPGTSFGAFFWNRGPGYLNQHIFRVDVDSEVVDKPYLRYALNSLIDKIIDQSHGGVGLKHITKGKLEEIQIPLPPLSEQRRIAAILDKADALRAKRRLAIAKLDQLLQSVFLEMFGDPVTNPKGLRIERLGDLLRSKPMYGSGAASIPMTPGLPRYVRITDINANGSLNEDARAADMPKEEWPEYRLKVGDILFARSGATVGKCFLYSDRYGDCVFAGYLIRCCPDESRLLPEFLFAFTRTEAYRMWVESHSKVVAQPNINAKQFSDLPIPVPSLDEQRAFLRHVRQIDQMRGPLDQSSVGIEKIFGSLQHQVFNAGLMS